MGAAEGKSIVFEGVLTTNDEIMATAKLAFPGITLDAIPKRASFFTTSYGGSINNKGAICVGMHESRHYDGEGKCDKLALQCAVYDGGYTKCVIIVLTNGAGGDGVYVQRVAQCFKSGTLLHDKYYTMNSSGDISSTNSPSSWSTSGTGYRLAGLRICGASPTAAGKADVVAFPGATLNDIKDCNFESFYRIGRSTGIPATNNVAIHVTAWPASDNPEKLVMQFTHPNDMYKTAVIQMTNGVDGVYAFQSYHTWNGTANFNTRRFAVNSSTGEVTANNSADKGSASATSDDPPQYQVHGIYALPPCVKKTPNKTKAWAGKTLDDIKDGTFTARMCGSWMGLSFRETPDSAVGYNKKVYEGDGGSVTNIIVEFQVRDGSSTKCLVVSFENGEDGVYASAIDGRYSSDAIGYTYRDYDGTWHGTAVAPAETITASGYGVFDLRVAVEEATEWILDQDRTWSELKGGATLAADEVVRIKVTGPSPTLTIDENVAVAKIEFVNALVGGVSTNSVAVSGGATVTFGTLALGQNARVAVPGSFVPSDVTLDPGSTLVCASGEAVYSAYSGLGAVEVAPGATLFVDSNVTAPYILNNGTVVKRVAGTVLMPFHNASKGVTIVSNGTLKVSAYNQVAGNPYAFVTEEAPHANQLIDVKSGATYDVNGFGNVTAAVRLEEGAKIVNSSSSDVSYYLAQTFQLILDGDATATATGNFGILAPGYNEARLQLGSHTLTLDGGKYFYLCNTTISGDGTIAVENGRLWTVSGASTGADCTVSIGSNGTMDFGHNLTVKNFVNGGSILGANTLTVTGTLTPGSAALPKLTLANGATVKASASAAQTVSTTFKASGTITIDASEITSAQLRNATDGRIPVLTVPSVPSGVTWSLYSPNASGRLRWNGNTLYLNKDIGLMFFVR